ncbi:MAG: hypothetical protein EOO88_40175 [Pedobacter sp.]|nr:MAG: hypothetical protein EOO88_40175 [Pedobacter sp.]
MSRSVKYLLVTAFILAVLIIVFLQFNSNRSINGLIQGNDNLLNHIEVKTNLQRLQTRIVAYESKVRIAVISDASTDRSPIASELESIYSILPSIDSLSDTDSSFLPSVTKLNQLVKDKVAFNQAIIDTFTTKGKKEAEAMIATLRGQRITDSIKDICIQLELLHERRVTHIILTADDNGKNAKTLGTIMAIIAVLSSIFIFIYIANRVRVQQQLIARLNHSERKAKEAAQVKENFLANMSHEIRTPLMRYLAIPIFCNARNWMRNRNNIYKLSIDQGKVY